MSSIISLLDFLLLLGAGVPESGMAEEVALTWKERRDEKMSVCTTAILLEAKDKISSDFFFPCACLHMFSQKLGSPPNVNCHSPLFSLEAGQEAGLHACPYRSPTG